MTRCNSVTCKCKTATNKAVSRVRELQSASPALQDRAEVSRTSLMGRWTPPSSNHVMSTIRSDPKLAWLASGCHILGSVVVSVHLMCQAQCRHSLFIVCGIGIIPILMIEAHILVQVLAPATQ